jgi:hypothetical protein
MMAAARAPLPIGRCEGACMPIQRTRWVVVGVVALFIALVGTIVLLRVTKAIGFELAMLMLVALLGMYVGFGILIAVYRLIGKLE